MDGICKSFSGIQVLRDVGLELEAGQIICLAGENGAGKSTLIKILTCNLERDGGSILFDGKEICDMGRDYRALIGYLPQESVGYPRMRVGEFLEYIAALKGLDYDRKQLREIIYTALEQVHLDKEIHTHFGQLSGGMKRRLLFAQAVMGDPKILILDEPTNGLDPAGIQEMRALIRNMPAATGATVLISSHLLGEMEQMVEQVGIIDHGHILFEGPLTELQRHSRGNVTLRLLNPAKAAPILRANGLTAHSDSCVVTLPPLQDALLADLVQKLAACGAGVVELTPRTKTLEEIFLSLTSEEAD